MPSPARTPADRSGDQRVHITSICVDGVPDLAVEYDD
jgi:hypothetical protein